MQKLDARLRILWGNTRGGSSPLSRTNCFVRYSGPRRHYTRTTFIRNATNRGNPDPASDANDRTQAHSDAHALIRVTWVLGPGCGYKLWTNQFSYCFAFRS